MKAVVSVDYLVFEKDYEPVDQKVYNLDVTKDASTVASMVDMTASLMDAVWVELLVGQMAALITVMLALLLVVMTTVY